MKQFTRWVMVFFGGVVAVAIALLFMPQMEKRAEMQARLDELREDAANANARHQDYRVRQERFQTDPRYVEQVAHEIGMVNPGEIIFKFHESRDARSGNAN